MSYSMAECWEMESSLLEAKEVYVVMQNDYRISRNIRAQWFFKNLNKTLTFKWKTCQLECTEEIEVISAIPKHMENFKVDSETNSSCIKIVPDTKVNFLSTQYRLVFCLDLSSSVATIDVQHDNIYFQEIYSSLEQSLKSLSEPFFVPGSRFFFIPQIFITVIAHIPNCAMAAPQVLVQGWILIPENINSLLELLNAKLIEMCKVVKKISTSVQEEQIQFMMPHDASGTVIDGTIDGNKMIKKLLDLSADISTLKIIRYGILALQLLPENSSAGIIVITDGVLSFPNCKSLDSLLTQLRNSTIACSFIQLGSPFHPFSSFGRVPYKELMEFISTATCGAYFSAARDEVTEFSRVNEMNIYHKSLLFWTFQKTALSYFLEAYEPSSRKDDYWHIQNPHFYTVAHQSRVKKKHTEGTLKVSLENLLSCRLREGYSVKSVLIDELKNSTEVKLVLPWMLSTNIEYIITSSPARKSASDIPSCHFEVIVDGCYEFLHDVTCSDKKPIKSLYRKTVIAQFWNYIKNLSNTDQILMQLHSFAHNPVYYTIPDSIKNGVPLFYFPTNSSMPVLSSKNVANVQFTSFWKPLCMLDINVWQKWMHAHRIGIILQHDMPLPKNLHLPNSSGRYVHVQCRQATAALNSLLSEHSSFALVENHSYIKLLFDDPDKPPFSFYVIRVTSKPPCVVIRLAFLGGLPGHQRFKIVNDLRQKILNLKRAISKDSQSSKQLSSNSPESCCCFLLKKPVEKVLIRYEKLPTNFLISVPDSQYGIRGSHKYSDSYADALITLSKYLQQQRWVWTLQYESNTSLDLPSASKILYTLTSIRLEEGFRFSHSGSGIIYMVQEIPVQVHHGETSERTSPADTNCCVVQYILFPPHTNTTLKDSTSEDDDIELAEADGELQLITECWVEPQLGTTAVPPKLQYLDGATFSEISNAIHKKDLKAVTVLTTFEHLCVLSDKNSKLPTQLIPLQSSAHGQFQVLQSSPSTINPQVNIRTLQENVSVIPYCFNLLSLLQNCPQTEIMISALHTNIPNDNEKDVAGNDILFDFLIENIKCFHNHEIILTPEDNLLFSCLIHHRDRNLQENPVPFHHPEINISDFSSNQSFLGVQNKCAFCSNVGCSALNLSDNSHRPLLDCANLKEEEIAKWLCFVRGYSSSHIILTLIPASFKDLKKLYPPLFNSDLPENISEVPKTNETVNEGNYVENVEDDGLNSKDTKSKDSVSATESSAQENADQISLSPDLLCIPLYIYSGVSTSIINQLVSPNCEAIKDSFIKYTFEYENCIDEQSNISSGHLITPSQYSDGNEDQYKGPKKDPHFFNLKKHCSLIEKSYSKAFVYSVYRSLLQGNSVHKFDAIAAIDEICEENLLEVDITEFVSMICGHVKDFMTKQSVRQMHLAEENDNRKVVIEDKLTSSESDKLETSEKHLFPLSVLLKHQPCELLQQKHLNVKDKFMEIIKSFFKAIPTRPDYFYFNYVEEDENETSLRVDEEESHEEDGLHDESFVEFGEDYQGNEVDKASSNFPEDETSAKSLNTDSSLSSFDKDTEAAPDKNLYPPLFVHFSCSVRRNKQEIKSCPLSSLPTCLNDVKSCFDTDCNEMIDLEDLRITLDITCLTVPNDIANPDIERQRVYSTSFSSSSPIPETEYYRKQQVADDENDSDTSEVPSDTIQGGTLQNLSRYQREAVLKCIDKIKWLLQDEKASVALDSFPITSRTLNMVVEHVESSKEKLCCIIKEIPLMFVYGADSLDKFIQAFKRMSPVGYRLNAIGDIYYLVLDAESAKKLNRPFGSLEPPLGIVDKYQIVKPNLHFDDHTELKKIAEEMKDSLVFPDHEFSYLQRRNSDGANDDFKPSSANTDAIFSLLRDKSSRKFQQDDDTDTEDGNDVHRSKSKFHRKTSKKYDTFPHSTKRTHSTPTFGDFDKKSNLDDRPNTAPPKLSHLESELQADNSSWNLSERKYLASKSVDNWTYEMPVNSPFGSSPDPSVESKDLHLTSSVTSVSRFKQPDSVGSPVIYSEAEYGSFHFSNTEDGYDGDSSDTGSDWDWLSTVDTRRPVLPKFWLIMKVYGDKVVVYFHMRERSEEDPELIQCKIILNEVISIVSNICKEVNQVLLLLSLYETRKCNRLLVPEDNDDLWKNRDLDSAHSLVADECDQVLEVQEKYLEATLKLEPGAFSCPVVWVTHFRLHHRLTTLSPGTTKSQGMHALRSVLSTFSVINRENMFVYQEIITGSVFYLRLFEENCEENHYSGVPKQEDNTSLVGSYCSSLQSIPQKKLIESEAETEFRPRVNSGASDSYRQDSISTTSASKRTQKCVALYVHGIGEVGTAITNELVQVLQNRLNESILDIIIGMLSRNPQCMLTPEDVQFIQNPSSPPTHEIHFTLPVKLLGYAHSIHIYLRQNMLHFLYNPKYTDNRTENHFKAYSHNSLEWMQTDDNDIFLYYSKPAFGQPGGKGISCIVLSLVTGQGTPYQNFSNLLPNPSSYQDGFSESEFEGLTSTSVYVMKKDRTPGPVALIRFHIWSVGKDSIKHLEQRLESAVRQALWDLLMEYKALTSPISDSSLLDDSSCYSEPTTPIKIRRSGLAGIDSNINLKEFHTSSGLQTTKEISSSVPDITTKTHSPPSLLKEITAFKFGSGPQSAKPEFHTEAPKSSQIQSSPNASKTDKRNLNYMFHSLLKPFLQFGDKLGCPALFKSVYTLPSRQSIYLISKDIQNIFKNVSRDFPNMYLEVKNSDADDVDYVPFNPYPQSLSFDSDDLKPGTIRNFIIIGRNEIQWKAYMGNYDFMKFHESNSENMKTYQKFQTHICCPKNIESLVDSVPSSPTWAVRTNSATVGSPQTKASICTSDRLNKNITASHFVPRQRLFLMYVEDKEITMYLYNWPQDITQNLLQQLSKQISWHRQRNCLLNNIILQKLGIFHGLSSYRVEKVSTIKDDKPSTVKNSTEESLTTAGPATIEQLIHNQGFSKDAHTSSTSSRSSVSRSAYLMRSLKNLRPHVPFHLSSSANIKDPLTAHGLQYLDTASPQRRDMQVLYNMWHTRGSSVNYPYDRVFSELKHSARLSHYCLTPILFSPSWRWKVAPIRDHALEPLDQNVPLNEKPDPNVSNRSRHSSGSSLKNIETSGSNIAGSVRSRRMSGSAAFPGSNQSSPKLRTKTPSEETWHSTVCRHYLQEYVQYLHTLGFVSLQTSDTVSVQSNRRSVGNVEEDKLSRSDSFSQHRHSIRGPPVFYLIKCLLGGLLVFEVGLSEPYAYAHLYSVEGSRFKACSARALNSQFIAAFLDELDKVKLHMHLHSFTYDYHLRTIHSYISGRQLIFRHGYHLTSFLDDFIKYYQKAPTGAHNLLHAGSITISDTNMSAAQLYNYIISHNQLYGMTVLRMVPVILDSSSNIDTEFALVELSAQKASYKDFNDMFQMGNFDFGLLINQNTTEVTLDSNALVLNFYIILTSQRDLYPKLSNFGTTLGSFQTVRYGSAQSSSSYPSRKTSAVSMVTEKDKFESSGEESTNSGETRSKKISIVRGMCDEDVTYLGYFSSQETVVQQVLQRQAEVAQTHLKGVVQRASVHCRRDSLWSSLLPRSLKDENSTKEHVNSSPSSYADFAELLDLVSIIPLCDIDKKLTPFMNMHILWYVGLAPVLKAKYADSHREYKSPDGNSIHVVVTNMQCPDSFLLLTVDVQVNRADLSVVFREHPGDMDHTEEPNIRTLALHSLIEGFVNACCFHLWSSILS